MNCKRHKSLRSLREHGFCRAVMAGTRLDVFLPIVPFYEAARGAVQMSGSGRTAADDLGRRIVGGLQDDVLSAEGLGRYRANSSYPSHAIRPTLDPGATRRDVRSARPPTVAVGGACPGNPRRIDVSRLGARSFV